MSSRAAKPKLLIGIFIYAVALLSSPIHVQAFTGNGAGSSADPYEITNCAQLQAVKDNLSARYELMNSIDCAAQTDFMPISGSGSFTGTFDGNNYTIDNLTINPAGSPDNVSLFGHLDGATIRDFTLDHAHITGGDSVGSIAGQASNSTTISGIKLLNGFIQGTNNVGGFVGSLGTIGDRSTGTDRDVSPALRFSESKNTTVQGFADTTRTSRIGGAAGEYAGTIKYVSTEGSVNGNAFDNNMSDHVGGLAGEAGDEYLGGIELSYSRADVTGGTYVGGLAGSTYYGTFNYSYSAGNVIGESYVGGLAGASEMGYSYYNFSDSVITGGFPTGALYGHFSWNRLFVQTVSGSLYDSVRSTQPNCVGYDELMSEPSWGPVTITGSCSDIAGQTNYFFNNDSTVPFGSWDFVNDWLVQTDDYPLLRGQPGEPTAVSVTPGSTSLKVSWDAPEGAQQAPITGYRLEYAVTGNTAMTVIPVTNPTASSYTITGLDASTNYSLRLRAINQAGGGQVLSLTALTTAPSESPAPAAPASSDSNSDKPEGTSQSQPAPISTSADTSPLQTANNNDITINNKSGSSPSAGADASQEPSDATVSLNDSSASKKSPSSVWWWLIITAIAATIWFWRKQKAKHT